MELCFLAASRGNAFMTEILQALAASVAEQGVSVSFEFDRYPPFADDRVYVVIPHEFFVLAPDGGAPTPGHLRRTVGLCVEQPGTPWFTVSCHFGQQLGGLADIRRSSIEPLRLLGLAAVHAPLGYTPLWDRWERDERAERPVDVLYMGAADARRERLLASYSRTLANRVSRLLVAPTHPKPGPGPSFVLGAEKHELLRSAKTLLNLHRAEAQALEWPRVLEAICNGCVVVTERSVDMEPLEVDEHVIAGRAESLCLLADRLLDDPDRLARVRRDAYDFVRSTLPMSAGATRLVELAESVVARSLRRASAERLRPLPPDPEESVEAVEEAVQPLRRALKRLVVEVGQTRRELAALGDEVARGQRGPALTTIAETPAWADTRARVTVAISVHDYEVEVRDALASVAASEYEDYEVLLIDDASTDESATAACAFLDAHPWMPAALLAHSHNAGLARTRNALAQRARGELLFVLDADNGLYPHGLRRLVQTLDADPEALFAYPIIAVHEHGQPAGLLSRHDWAPALLREDNPIDAMSLIRRDALLELGGYCEDPRLVGWEDYDLWCQIAERGGRGVHVPEILAWYRRTNHSMLTITGLDLTEGKSLLASRAPRVFAPAGD